MKIHKNKSAFTLVELIVVITILAILGMIAFISLQGYSADARDSSRISDINHIKTSLELQSLEAGKYPMPDNYQDVTLSGGTIVWHQGTVGENVTKILSRNLNERPTDPLYNTEYIYSVTPSQNQYEVMSMYEGDMVYNGNQSNSSLVNQPHPSPLLRGEGIEGGLMTEQANALSKTVKIDGTYNGVYVKNGDYIIPTPSLITSLDPTGLELNEITIKSQVINRGTNVPNIGTPKITQSTGALTFSTFEVYNGELNEESSTGAFLSAYQAIANTYNGSSVANEGVIKTLLTQTTDEQKIEFTKSLILNTVSSSLTYNCDETTKPTDNGHITYTTSPATSVNQAYIQDAPNCGFTCIDGYTGSDCSVVAPTVQYTSNCTANGQIYYADSSGNKLATVTNAGVATWESGKSISDLTCAGHIIVCSGNNAGYTLQACNLGATTLYTNQTFASISAERTTEVDSRAGYLYQWGRNKGFTGPVTQQSTTIAGTVGLNAGTDTYGFVWNGALVSPNTWANSDITDNWGDTTNTSIARQGPCASGYHVPSQTEWSGIVNVGGWGTNGTNMMNSLKLPMTGRRGRNSGTMYFQGNDGFYWSSSPRSTSGYIMYLVSNYITCSDYGSRAMGFSLRCIKN